MYFWKIDVLKNDITSNKLTEKDRFLYAIIYILISAFAFEALIYLPPETTNIWDIINSTFTLLTVFVSTCFCYKANGGANGVDFLGRYFSINFVVGIRFMVFSTPLFIALFFYYSTIPYEQEIVSSPIDTIPFIVWYIWLYIRIIKHMRDLNN